MPSVVLGNPYASGAQLVCSGAFYSGQLEPKGGLQLLWIGSGNAYIAFSGGGPPLSGGFMTINSGQMNLSGGCASGMIDGMCVPTGASYFIPALAFTNRGVNSGNFNIWALTDTAASGGRLYFEFF